LQILRQASPSDRHFYTLGFMSASPSRLAGRELDVRSVVSEIAHLHRSCCHAAVQLLRVDFLRSHLQGRVPAVARDRPISPNTTLPTGKASITRIICRGRPSPCPHMAAPRVVTENRGGGLAGQRIKWSCLVFSKRQPWMFTKEGPGQEGGNGELAGARSAESMVPGPRNLHWGEGPSDIIVVSN
jgi:hypothetical protein